MQFSDDVCNDPVFDGIVVEAIRATITKEVRLYRSFNISEERFLNGNPMQNKRFTLNHEFIINQTSQLKKTCHIANTYKVYTIRNEFVN